MAGSAVAKRPRTRTKRRNSGAKPAVLSNADAVEVAKDAGLRYVSDESPGITRKRIGRNKFTYIGAKGKTVTDDETRIRIRNLAIPPAWEDVWICSSERGHLQAVGRDARGRKQYRYHADWRKVRDENKYEKIIDFAQALPKIRKRSRADLRKAHLPREKVLAAVVQLLEKTLIRVGNDEYARDNKSYGLTTMRDHHADVNGSKIRFEFRGKSGIAHKIDLHDRGLAEVVSKCQDLPGQELLQYIDEDGKVVDVGSSEVNEYLREITGEDFTAKDFRTWAGTVLAARALKEFDAFHSQSQAKKNVVAAIESVAKKLGNTKAVCRKCYIHPAVLDSYLDGSMIKTLRQRAASIAKSKQKLSPEESAVLSLLQRGLTPGSKKN